MPNHLEGETSPYLLQHANNPVDWFPWGDLAFQKAKREDKPIFLSIGYSACHWCHVMERETFENPDIAKILNAHFISIKVDREERPDIDEVYMSAVVAMTGQGGWPTSVFLTPDGAPFFGGTYFPPVRRAGMPSFVEILIMIANLWSEKRAEIEEAGEKITLYLNQSPLPQERAQTPDHQFLQNCSEKILEQYDWNHGGFGNAPKFPHSMAIEYLLGQISRGNHLALEAMTHNLNQMCRGGIYDVVGGGFHRYATDQAWSIPHFEKMLYDNALLVKNYLHAYLLTKNLEYKWVVEDTLDFVQREMKHSDGGFFSSLDADSEGEEGKYYLWEESEIKRLLANLEGYQIFEQVYGIHKGSHFNGKVILRRNQNLSNLSEIIKIEEIRLNKLLTDCHAVLLQHRSKRIKPLLDDKIIAMWNAIMCSAFCEAGRILSRHDYVETAKNNAEFVWHNLYSQPILARSWRDGKTSSQGFLEDYAAWALAFLDLYQTDFQYKWYQRAFQLTENIIEFFMNENLVLQTSGSANEKLFVTRRQLEDNATPSGVSLAIKAFLQLTYFDSDPKWKNVAEVNLQSALPIISNHPLFYANWLQALDFSLGPVKQVAIICSEQEKRLQEFLDVFWSSYHPRRILAIIKTPTETPSPKFFTGKKSINGLTTAYICQGNVCGPPITSLEALTEELNLKS